MNILVRRTTIWAIAAFFGCVSLLGPGWHCVFGHHFHGPGACTHEAVDPAQAHCHDTCCASRPNSGEQLPSADSAGAAGEPAVAALANPEHHCPLCQFFGTAQWSPALAPTELVLVATELIPSAAPSREREAPRLYLSRAPPRHLAAC